MSWPVTQRLTRSKYCVSSSSQSNSSFVSGRRPAFAAFVQVRLVEVGPQLVPLHSCLLYAGALNWVDFFAISPFYFELMFSNGGGGSSAILRIIRLVSASVNCLSASCHDLTYGPVRPSARRFAFFAFLKRRATFRGFTFLCRRCFSHCSHFLCSSLSSSSLWSCVRISGPVESRACHSRACLYAHICHAPSDAVSSAIYFAERGTWDASEGAWMRVDTQSNSSSVSPYQSIPASMWWCVVTMTTVRVVPTRHEQTGPG